jgi:hypothetical protein
MRFLTWCGIDGVGKYSFLTELWTFAGKIKED